MGVEIKPVYEILYGDLKNHSIGDFLVSRDFKLKMSQKSYYEIWQDTYEKIKKDRRYVSVGFDHNWGDNLATLAVFLNASHEDVKVEFLVSYIIRSFIEYKKTDEDFSDVIEAMNVANFSEQAIKYIEKAYKTHKSLNLPKEETLESTKKPTSSITNKKDVFIVHGHNEEIKEKVARTLEKLKLNPIILHEQSNEGQTVIEKLEKNSNVGFAVILLTHDDYGNIKSDDNKNKRARQNVILELGYFIAKIGRKNVMPLYEKGIELPSDFSGVLYTLIDKSEIWKPQLVRELKAAGYKVNADDLF